MYIKGKLFLNLILQRKPSNSRNNNDGKRRECVCFLCFCLEKEENIDIIYLISIIKYLLSPILYNSLIM